jgi:hypothetical protein
VPIVFVTTIDPVGGGWVEGLSRPGTNATGFASYEFSMSGKWLELLKEIAPGVKRVAVIRDPSVPAGSGGLAAIQTVAPSLSVELTPAGVRVAALREFDLVMAWSVDRLGRSLQDLVGFLSELHALKIDLFLRQQGLDTTTPAGKAMFQILGVFAEFERAMIAERVRAGLARARSEGKRLGRPPIAPALEKRIRKALGTPGRPGVRVIAKQFGVDPGTVQRISRPFDRVGVVVA